jgi:hypothetical protein
MRSKIWKIWWMDQDLYSLDMDRYEVLSLVKRNIPLAFNTSNMIFLDLIPGSLSSLVSGKDDDEGVSTTRGFVRGMLSGGLMSGFPVSFKPAK